MLAISAAFMSPKQAELNHVANRLAEIGKQISHLASGYACTECDCRGDGCDVCHTLMRLTVDVDSAAALIRERADADCEDDIEEYGRRIDTEAALERMMEEQMAREEMQVYDDADLPF